MKKIFIMIVLQLFLMGCSSEKTDSELLAKDKQALLEALDSHKVGVYKFGKILLRASAVEEREMSDEFQAFRSEARPILKKLMAHNPESMSIMDYISLYRQYKTMRQLVMETDEDAFPTLSDAYMVINGEPVTLLTGEEKIQAQNLEHAVLSVVVLLSRGLGEDISLYECAQTKPALLPDSEVKTMLQYFRGFLFFEKGLHYLSEDEISRNIVWLQNNQDVDLQYTRAVFQWQDFDNQQSHIAYRSLNYLFRGLNRLMMDREIDEQRALEDFEVFVKDSQKLGLSNEITWSAESFLYLKREDKEKAIASLQKLRTSELLSEKERARIDESIDYLKNRESGKLLNSAFDKYFLAKIVTKYIFARLAEVDWEKLLKQHNVPYTEEMFTTLDNFTHFIDNLESYTSSDKLKETGETLKNQSQSLWNRAKELVE